MMWFAKSENKGRNVSISKKVKKSNIETECFSLILEVRYRQSIGSQHNLGFIVDL
jgi:hypothetical protein